MNVMAARRQWFTTLVAMFGLLVSPLASPAAAAVDEGSVGVGSRSGQQRRMEELRTAIERDGEVQVVISLDVEGGAAIDGAADLDRLRQGVDDAQKQLMSDMAAETIEDADLTVHDMFDSIAAMTATVRSAEALDQLMANSMVGAVSPDVAIVGGLESSVAVIGADLRQSAGNFGAGVTVAMMDTGVDLQNPDLSDDIVEQACFVDSNESIDGVGFCPDGSDRQFGDGAAQDDAGHGSLMTGVVTSAGTVAPSGVAPEADIVAIKVLDNSTFSGSGTTADLLAAWDWITVNNDTLGIDVLNMSLGGGLFVDECDADFPAAATAIANLRSIGVAPFGITGNRFVDSDLVEELWFPGCLSDVISVGAVTDDDIVAPISRSNDTTDLFAPGVEIESSALGGGTQGFSGTSLAAPHAAGCAALLIEAGEATTPDAIEARLETSPVRVTDSNGLTFPRIDCGPAGVGDPPDDPGPGDPPPSDGEPTVSFESDAPVDENTPLRISGTVSDPDLGDSLSVTVDWGDGSAPETLTGESENAAPDATLSFDADHVYGDNGTFWVEVCGTDGAAVTCESIEVQVDNVGPRARINRSGATRFPGGRAFVARTNRPLELSGRVTDPGSDDLVVTWDWDDGPPAPDVTTEFPNDPSGADPAPSPDINPRNVTDSQSNVYQQACLYRGRLSAVDDDGGASTSITPVIVVGRANRARSVIFWFRQYRSQSDLLDDETLGCYLQGVRRLSSVFNEERFVSTFRRALQILRESPSDGAVVRLDRELLTAWLNFVNGGVAYDEAIDTDGDGTADTTLAEAIASAEAVRLDEASTRRDLRAERRILEMFNG